MNIKATKSRSSYALFLVLFTAFLTMQWTTAHIHLDEQHQHGGVQHQHQFEAHAHDFSKQYIVAIDLSHQASHANVIEFDHGYNLPKRVQQKNPAIVVAAAVIHPPRPFAQAGIKMPVLVDVSAYYFDRSVVSPRAPPQTS